MQIAAIRIFHLKKKAGDHMGVSSLRGVQHKRS